MAKESKLQQIPVPIVIGVLVIALLAIGWQLWRSFGPDPDLKRGENNNRFITQMALKSGGDLSRLSPDELAQLQKLTKGRAQMVLSLHPSSAIGRARLQGSQTSPRVQDPLASVKRPGY